MNVTSLLKEIIRDLESAYAETEKFEALASRAYPGLKMSGLCSRHREDGAYGCPACYPDLNKLLKAHMVVFNKLYDELLELSGLKDPENGRVGTNAILTALRAKLDGKIDSLKAGYLTHLKDQDTIINHLREELKASRCGADELRLQRNNLRTFVEENYGHEKMVEVINHES